MLGLWLRTSVVQGHSLPSISSQGKHYQMDDSHHSSLQTTNTHLTATSLTMDIQVCCTYAHTHTVLMHKWQLESVYSAGSKMCLSEKKMWILFTFWIAISVVQIDLPTSAKVKGGDLEVSYKAVGLHLHWGKDGGPGSEHTIDGERYPMEVWLPP